MFMLHEEGNGFNEYICLSPLAHATHVQGDESPAEQANHEICGYL